MIHNSSKMSSASGACYVVTTFTNIYRGSQPVLIALIYLLHHLFPFKTVTVFPTASRLVPNLRGRRCYPAARQSGDNVSASITSNYLKYTSRGSCDQAALTKFVLSCKSAALLRPYSRVDQRCAFAGKLMFQRVKLRGGLSFSPQTPRLRFNGLLGNSLLDGKA
jgi:hypothetical protein